MIDMILLSIRYLYRAKDINYYQGHFVYREVLGLHARRYTECLFLLGKCMAKLQFIKLDIEIMNDSKIKMIRKMPDGAKLFELWIGLLCLGMKSGRPGCVEIGDGIPFTARMLSAELDIPETTIELGLQTFTDLRMIEQFEDSTFFLSNFEKHQELEKIEIKRINERDRKRKYRDKVKLLSHGTGRGRDGDGTKCPTVDIDVDIDKEEDTYKLTDLVIEYFNNITGQKRRCSKTSRNPIHARLEDSFSMDDCRKVIDIKYNEWKDNKDMQKYITIETFFRPSNFEKYLNQEMESIEEEMRVDDEYDPTGRLAREKANAI